MSEPIRHRKLFISLGTRLTVPVVLLMAAVALGAYLGLVRTFRATALRSKETAADMVVKLTSISVMPAVVFGDELEMQRAVDALAKNTEVTDVELWGVDAERTLSQAPLAKFHRGAPANLRRPDRAASLRSSGEDSVLVHEPVLSQEGKGVGLLAVRFSTAHEARAVATLSREILIVSVATAGGLALAILLVLTRFVVLPIRRLQRASERLARGEGEAAVDAIVQPSRVEDEVKILAASFKGMADAVRDREQRLAVRNQELRLILDSVDQGFVTSLLDGTLLPERSAIIEKWLGELPSELKVWDMMGLVDPSARSWARGGWDQMADGLLPLAVSIDQLPKRLVHEERHFDFTYHPVLTESGSLDRVVVVLTDVTAEVGRQRAVAEQHEFSVLVDQFVRDRRAFYDFWNEACQLVERIVGSATEGESVRRDLHTLKGNSRYFGLKRLATLCHELEDAMADRGATALSAGERARLNEAWSSLRSRIEPLINGATAFVEISEDEYRRLALAVQGRESHDALAELVRGLKREPTAWRLARARDALVDTCKKLGKAPVEVVIHDNDLRLPPGRFAPFWSVLSHVLANAIDHGIEADDARRAKGKQVPGRVELRTELDGRELVVEVKDDGAGIDWERVRAAARDRGLPHGSHRELTVALLTEGFSLKSALSDVSGRGVGLAAVSNVVNAMGGRIEIDSTLDVGASWRFRLPAGPLDRERSDDALVARTHGADAEVSVA